MSKRWSVTANCFVENGAIDAFLAEVIEVSKKHGLSIGHEDGHGAFTIGAYNDASSSWLADAFDDTPDQRTVDIHL